MLKEKTASMSSKFVAMNLVASFQKFSNQQNLVDKDNNNNSVNNYIHITNSASSGKQTVYEQQMQAFWYTLSILMFYALLILYFMLKQICRQVI